MIAVFSGENQEKSREAYTAMIENYKKKGVLDLVFLDGRKVQLTELIQACQSASLFNTERLVCLERLFSSPQSKRKKEVISFLIDEKKSADIVVWEPKKLTPAQAKKFEKSEVLDYPVAKVLFTFLESLAPGNVTRSLTLLTQACTQESVDLVFAMIIRQAQLLLQVKDGISLKMAPWQKQRLFSQAKKFTIKELIMFHERLLKIDIDRKTSGGLCNLQQNLDRLILEL